MPDVLSLPFAQRGLLELALLAVGAGLVGTWVVLRGLAFYTHAVGTATFPGLVLADGLGFAPVLGAAGTGVLCAIGVVVLARGDVDRERDDAATALILVAALAAGVILASDVFASGGQVDQLLFGSLLVIGTPDLVLAGVASAVAVVAGALLEHRWVAAGFDPRTAPALRAGGAASEAVLLAVVTLVALATLVAVGALLATALLVVPAATTRLVCTRLRTWQAATVVLVLVEGMIGVWLSVETDAPPGAAIAVLAGAAFVLVAGVRVLRTRRRLRPAVAAAALLALLGATGCGGSASGSGDGPRVVVTTTQLGDLVREVSGGKARVTQLLRPNTDPHEYEPRPSDVRAAAGAKVVVSSGDGLDQWVDKVVEQAGDGDADRVDAGASRPVRRTGPDGKADPHWWHDPRNAEAAVTAIERALIRADRANADVYARRAASTRRDIAGADRAIARCFAIVPPRDRKLVTDHDAFGYFAARYGIRVIGAVIPATTTQAQPSAGDLAALARTVRREQVHAIFPESSLNPRLARAVARETGARVGEALYADTLGPEGSAGGTYIAALRTNADRVMRGLTGGERGCAA
jgi:ABC-type Zn uptake system ZnuABC Zn-binding protein ZnuA/ABC-type Mn2+/Zn2+ transport system permease subunit